ncbi:MAG: glycerol-3-phosphate ABC transporter permease [Phototrophicales bacterium]|nr:MAG: glycerol-3-phosphate ABC transporter permease [Phototrophicales bacterium]
MNASGSLMRGSIPYQTGIYILLIVVSVILLSPLLFSLSLALQGPTVAPSIIPRDLTNLDWRVFIQVFEEQPVIARWIVNSFVAAFGVTLGVLISSSLFAYVLAYFNFPGKTVLLFIALGSLMVPFEATLIPNYLLVTQWGWTNTYQGLIVPFIASGFGIFLMRQYFLTLPRELYDAAMVDGCSRFRYLWLVLLPLSRPALATLAVYTFLGTWNQFYWPLLVTSSTEWRTTQVGITIFRSFEGGAIFNMQMAATLIVMIPTLLLLVLGQRQLVSGLTAGALKG